MEGVKLNYQVVDTALEYGATLGQLRASLGRAGQILSTRTIQRAIERDKGVTFSDYREMMMSDNVMGLKQKAIQMGLSGDRTMLIFSLKNIGDWSDTPMQTAQTEDLEFVDGENSIQEN